tara:strand:- start:68 stop:706 length:639 start_codon:yes stop_codon:yes gene_type:complete
MGQLFTNNILKAQNVLDIKFDFNLINHLIKEINKEDLHTYSPSWNSDIKWISNNSFRSYSVFYECFNNLQLSNIFKQFVDHKTNLMLYSGFFVSRSTCLDFNFHNDWIPECQNNAFTLITPLIHPKDGINLIYKDIDGKNQKYTYQVGKAIVFGGNFIHSTDIGTSTSPSVLLSMTFGTDKMNLWEPISKTALHQGNLVRLPNGNFINHSFD